MAALSSISELPNGKGFIINGKHHYLRSFEAEITGNILNIFPANRFNAPFSGNLNDVEINGVKYPGDPDRAIEALVFLGNFNGGSSNISGVFTIPDEFFFTSAAARDNFFNNNPEKLKEGIYISVNGSLEKYSNGLWEDVSVLVRGSQGLSAYEIAVENGFEGTEQEWLEGLSDFSITEINGGTF